MGSAEHNEVCVMREDAAFLYRMGESNAFPMCYVLGSSKASADSYHA